MPEPKVGEPEWWLKRLEKALNSQVSHMEQMDAYYRGDHPLPHIPPEAQRRYLTEYRNLLRRSRANFCRLVVDATKERMKVRGFRLSGSESAEADKEAWRIWQANQLDGESQLAFREALVKGRVYFSVWGGDPYPTIAVEDPMQTIVECEPGNPRKRAAALKTWVDDWTALRRANVYLPNGIYKFQAAKGENVSPERAWEPLKDEDKRFVPNPIGEVPIIPIINRPDISRRGESEIVDITDIQDRINTTIFNRMLAAWFTAFRQRWVTGLELEEDEHGNVKPPFEVAMDRLWQTESETVKFGEFSATDLEPYLKAHERDVQDIAVISRTPRHYLFQQGQSPSGDAIKSAETGLVAKVKDKFESWGEGLEEVVATGRKFAGEPDAPVDSEIIWADPEYRSEGEITDAVIKRVKAGLITVQQGQEDLGYTPQQIQRMESDRARNAMLNQGVNLSLLEDEETVA